MDPSGELIAVGLGYQSEPSAGFGQGAVPQRKDGSYLILKRTYAEKSASSSASLEDKKDKNDRSRFEESMMVIHEGRDSKQPITCCAFSHDSRVLAMGSADGNVYLYGRLTLGGWGPTATCRGFIGVLTHIDFSVDSALLQCCDSSGLLLFFEAQGNRVGEEV
jgi:WD40 repeat protein